MHEFNHGWMLADGGGWMALGWLWMLLFTLAPVFLLFSLFKYVFGSYRRNTLEEKPRRTALEILDEAYAKGEIAREEYLQKRDDLQGK